MLFLRLNFVLGGESGNDFAWDIVPLIHLFQFNCVIGGSSIGFEERSDSWDYWLLVIRSCEFGAIMVIADSHLFSVFLTG